MIFFYLKLNVSIQEKAIGNLVCVMADILSRPQRKLDGGVAQYMCLSGEQLCDFYEKYC